MRNLNDPWEIVCERAKLKDPRIHDARHSYASRALALGESLPMIGRLLDHTQVETTARYAHLAEDSVKESAVRIADSIAGDLLANYPGSVGFSGREAEAGNAVAKRATSATRDGASRRNGCPGRCWLRLTGAATAHRVRCDYPLRP